MSSASLQQALRNHGFKLTRARRALLQVLGQASVHLKAADLHRAVRAIDPSVGLASVYRTLNLLSRLGLLRLVHTNHRHRHYAQATHEHAHHLLCNDCGRVVEFSDCQVERLIKTLARRTRFVIEEHSIELYGRCPDCRRALDHGSTPDQARSISHAPRKKEVRCA